MLTVCMYNSSRSTFTACTWRTYGVYQGRPTLLNMVLSLYSILTVVCIHLCPCLAPRNTGYAP
jgi:hypothetical protein